jgi:hypothetical protein
MEGKKWQNTDSDLLYLRDLLAITMINPTIVTTIATTLKYMVFKQKINICLDKYYMYWSKRVWRYQKG